MPKPEASLDERACRVLGWQQLWIHGPEAGYAKLTWPPISTSWEWAGKAMEQIHSKLYTGPFSHVIGVEGKADGTWTANYGFAFVIRGAATGPEAIARAIAAMGEAPDA